MSLLRLLTTGKSLEGMDASVNRYQVTRERLLPKFGGVANPFMVTTRPSAKVVEPAAPAAVLPANAPAEAPRKAWTAKDWWNRVAASARTAASSFAKQVRAWRAALPGKGRGAGVFGGQKKVAGKNAVPPSDGGLARETNLNWIQRCIRWLGSNRRIAWFRPKPVALAKPTTIFHPSAKGPSQGELLLDQVKPVRNDLCDSDLEVIQTPKTKSEEPKTPAAESRKPDGTTSAEPSPTDKAWERVGQQLMGTGKS